MKRRYQKHAIDGSPFEKFSIGLQVVAQFVIHEMLSEFKAFRTRLSTELCWKSSVL